MSDTRSQAFTALGATGRVAMGTARFLFLALGASVFLAILLVGWWLSGFVPTISHGAPAFTWAPEQLAMTKATSVTATSPFRGREQGLQFGGPGTDGPFAAMILAERSDSAVPFTLTTPVFWQFGPLKVLGPRVGGPHYTMTTRFGRFTGRDIYYRESDGRTRTCIIFRNGFETAEFALGGFYCAPGTQTADAAPLACMIDKLRIEPGKTPSPAVAYLAARAGNAPQCSNTTFYQPGTRQIVRDRNGGVVRMRGDTVEAFPLWAR